MENNFAMIYNNLSTFRENFETFQKETNKKFMKIEWKLEEKASTNACDQLRLSISE